MEVDKMAAPVIHKNDLEIFEELARGGYGYIHRAKSKRNGWEMAIKCFTSNEDRRKLQREGEKMLSLKHRSIVTIHGLIENSDGDFVGVAMAYMGGGSIVDAKQRLNMAGVILPNVLMNQWNLQIAEGIKYIHEQGVVHKDIKAKNCLIDAHCNAKICDFELCRSKYVSTTTVAVLKEPRATCTHQPPECITDISKVSEYDTKFDIYSFGITMFEVYKDDSFPYPKEYLGASPLLYDAIENKGLRPDTTKIKEVAPQEVIELMKKCWHADPSTRPKADEIVRVLAEVCSGYEEEARDEAVRLTPFILEAKRWVDGKTYDEVYPHDGLQRVRPAAEYVKDDFSDSYTDNRVWITLTDEQAHEVLNLQKWGINLEKDRTVSDSCLQSLANQIGPKDYKNVGRRLLFEEYELDSFHHDYERLGIAEVNTKMLTKWKEVNDTNATYEWLATACLTLKRRDLIDTLLKA